MAWIESHQSLEKSRKLYELMAAMDWDKFQAIGRLKVFWWWCLDHAIDGNLTKFKPVHLALAIELDPRDSERFMSAMLEAGFIEREPQLRLRNWWTYVGKLLKTKYRQTPEKWQSIRDAYTSRETGGNPLTCTLGNAVGESASTTLSGRVSTTVSTTDPPDMPTTVSTNRTPNQTKPDQTKPVSDKARVRHSGQGGELSVTNAALPPPTLEKVLSECDRLQLPRWVGEDFFNLWESRAWRDRDTPVRNWKSLLNSKKNYWVSDGRPMKRPGKANDGSGNQGHAVPKNGKEWDIADVL